MPQTRIIRPARTTPEGPADADHWTDCMDPGYCVAMAPRADGRTPNRVVRIDDETWAQFGLACDELGTNRSDEIRRHVKAVIAAWKREQRREAQHATTAATD